MKIKEIKHNHSLTELLKICIFAILMIAPLFASISQMLYVTVNKNAYQSYSDNYIQKATLITDNNQLMVGATIQVYTQNTGNNYSGYLKYSSISIDWTDYGAPTSFTYNGFRYSYSSISLTTGSDNTAVYTISSNLPKEFQFVYASGTAVTNFGGNGTGYNKMYILTIADDTLDNAFYYGVNKMTESSLFNWTQNTAIYTPINTMTTQLGITTPAIAILITYWFILIVIYIVLDIVLKCFTMISHLIFRSS